MTVAAAPAAEVSAAAIAARPPHGGRRGVAVRALAVRHPAKPEEAELAELRLPIDPDPAVGAATCATRPTTGLDSGACSRSASPSPRSRRRSGISRPTSPATTSCWPRRGTTAPGLVVFPELGLTGYLLQDLASEVAMRLDDPRLAALAARDRRRPVRRRLVRRGVRRTTGCSSPRPCSRTAEVRHVHRKVHLPTYGLFDERRFFAPGDMLRAVPSRLGVGVGLAVCEDFWHLSTPQVLALDGAQILINVSSSPGRDLAATNEVGLGTATSWRDADAHLRPADDLVRRVLQPGRRRRVDLVLGRLRGDLADRRRAVFSAPMFDEGLFYADIDLAEVRRERISLPLLRDERPELVAREWRRLVAERAGLAEDSTAERGAARRLRRRDRRGAGRGERRRDGTRRCSCCPTSSRSTPASPGGSSRSSSAASCARRASSGRCSACRAGSTRRSSRTSSPRRSGPERLHCVLMPYRTSSPASRGDAEEVVRRLGCSAELVEITAMVDGYFGADGVAGRGGPEGLEAAPLRRGQLHGPDADERAVRPVGRRGAGSSSGRATRPSR